MDLLSHGLDTIELVFNNNNCNYDELNYIKSLLYGLHQDKTLRDEGNVSPLFSHKRRSYTKYPVNTTIDHIHVYSRVDYTKISLSLPRFVNGSNIEPLPYEYVDMAISEISERLGFDCSKGYVERIDYNFNISTQLNAVQMWDYINPTTHCLTKDLKHKSEDSSKKTLYIENKVRKVCCYSQLDNTRYSKSDQEYLSYKKKELMVNDIIRFEFRFFKDYLKYEQNGRKRYYQFSDVAKLEFQRFVNAIIRKLTEEIRFTNPELNTESNDSKMEFQNNPNMTCHDIDIQLHAKLLDFMKYGEIRDFINNASYCSDYHKKAAFKKLGEFHEFRTSLMGISESISDIPIIILNALNHTGNDES